MAASLASNDNRDLWAESKRINGTGKSAPSTIDGKTGDRPIASVFADKYQSLYNSVSCCNDDMFQLESQISQSVSNKCCNNSCYCSHVICVSQLQDAMKCLKAGKSDGFLSTDHIIHECPELLTHVSILFSCMVSHGFSPK